MSERQAIVLGVLLAVAVMGMTATAIGLSVGTISDAVHHVSHPGWEWAGLGGAIVMLDACTLGVLIWITGSWRRGWRGEVKGGP